MKFSATTEDGADIAIRAVLSPSTNTCLAPTAVSFNAKSPNPEEDHAIIENQKLPVHVIKGHAYVKLYLCPTKSKTRKDFCAQMGFAQVPEPSESE